MAQYGFMTLVKINLKKFRRRIGNNKKATRILLLALFALLFIPGMLFFSYKKAKKTDINSITKALSNFIPDKDVNSVDRRAFDMADFDLNMGEKGTKMPPAISEKAVSSRTENEKKRVAEIMKKDENSSADKDILALREQLLEKGIKESMLVRDDNSAFAQRGQDEKSPIRGLLQDMGKQKDMMGTQEKQREKEKTDKKSGAQGKQEEQEKQREIDRQKEQIKAPQGEKMPKKVPVQPKAIKPYATFKVQSNKIVLNTNIEDFYKILYIEYGDINYRNTVYDLPEKEQVNLGLPSRVMDHNTGEYIGLPKRPFVNIHYLDGKNKNFQEIASISASRVNNQR